ncbi:flagellar basal body protein FliL [Altererythrobacter halimionae]|uniref:Flagellar protein FliL n=2 Tax=Alteriqipengyuania halimionae TaxID=1926630 RepID=A0A6I4U6A4_9SPHN|nr:flagellar basal body protein FliL [Alteriqipengyuania halimionae]
MAAYLMGGDHAGSDTDGEHGDTSGEGTDVALVAVEPLLVNLRTNDGQARFLKLRILLAAESPDDVETIETKLPLIIDRYQPFLRELRPEDLAGSAAVYRLKEELILRAADAVGKGVVADVLIQDLIQQ